MSSGKPLVLETDVDFDGLEKGIAEAERAMAQMGGASKASFKIVSDSVNRTVADIYEFNGALEKAKRQWDRLDQIINVQKQTLANYKLELQRVSERYGESSEQALKLRSKILNLEEAIEKNCNKADALTVSILKLEAAEESATKETKDFDKSVKDASESMDEAKKGASELKDESDELGDGFQGAEDAVGQFADNLASLVANQIADALSSFLELADQTRDFRIELMQLEAAAEGTGANLESIYNNVGRWTPAFGSSDEVVSALTTTLSTLGNEQDAAFVLDAVSGAAMKFTDRVGPADSVLRDFFRTISNQQALGAFREVLMASNVNVDEFNMRIGRASTAAQAQDIALQALARTGGQEYLNNIVARNEALYENEQATFNSQKAASDLAEFLLPLNTFIKEFKAGGPLNEFLLNTAVAAGELAFQIKVAGWAIGSASKTAATGIGQASASLTAFAPAAATAGASFAALTLEAVAFGIAIASVLQAVANLVAAVKGNDMSGLFTGSINISAGGQQSAPQGRQKGYAIGTASASPGWRYVGENGPELVRFAGGERVMTAAQTRAALPTAGSTSNHQAYTDNRSTTLNINNMGTLVSVMQRMENEKRSIRQGRVKR